jgi:hypothetical protein
MDVDPDKQTGESLGIGNYHEHARNKLNATVANVAHLGEYRNNDHLLKWGANVQFEKIDDRINEWEWRDSAGYSLPYNNAQVNLYYNMNASNSLKTLRTTAFLQDTYKIHFQCRNFFVHRRSSVALLDFQPRISAQSSFYGCLSASLGKRFQFSFCYRRLLSGSFLQGNSRYGYRCVGECRY